MNEEMALEEKIKKLLREKEELFETNNTLWRTRMLTARMIAEHRGNIHDKDEYGITLEEKITIMLYNQGLLNIEEN